MSAPVIALVVINDTDDNVLARLHVTSVPHRVKCYHCQRCAHCGPCTTEDGIHHLEITEEQGAEYGVLPNPHFRVTLTDEAGHLLGPWWVDTEKTAEYSTECEPCRMRFRFTYDADARELRDLTSYHINVEGDEHGE